MAAAISRRLCPMMPPFTACSIAAASSRSRACDVAMPHCTVWNMCQVVQGGSLMSQPLQAEAECTVHAPAEAVWALVSDVTRYPEFGPWSAGGYRPPGDTSAPAPGAV